MERPTWQETYVSSEDLRPASSRVGDTGSGSSPTAALSLEVTAAPADTSTTVHEQP